MSESEPILLAICLIDFLLLGSARFRTLIRLVAAQGLVLGLLVLTTGGLFASPWRVWALAVATAGLKGFVFPRFLHKALRELEVQREEKPPVGPSASLLVALGLFGFSLKAAARLPLPSPLVLRLLLPAAFFTMLCGLFLITARRTALVQVLGYLVLENGVFLAGLALTREAPLSVELGILLDVFLGLFIMGLVMYHISREFDTLDTDLIARRGRRR